MAQGITAKPRIGRNHNLDEINALIAQFLKHEQVPQSDTKTPNQSTVSNSTCSQTNPDTFGIIFSNHTPPFIGSEIDKPLIKARE